MLLAKAENRFTVDAGVGRNVSSWKAIGFQSRNLTPFSLYYNCSILELCDQLHFFRHHENAIEHAAGCGERY